MQFGLIILNGTVFDGSGGEGFPADVGVNGDRITAVGDLSQCQAPRVIDAHGMIVCPGFVDPHVHTHWRGDPAPEAMHADNLLRQGVATVIVGNCGKSGWPVREVLARVEREGFKSNYAMLVGHHTIRQLVMGDSDQLCPDERQTRAMQGMVREGLDEGAFGVSVGYAQPHETTEEILEVIRPAAAGAVFASHIRSEGEGLIQAIGEIIELAERANIRAQVSHLKTAKVPNWGKLDIALKMMEDAAARGVDIAADRYPYIVPATGPTKIMPDWCYEEARKRGGKEHLKDPDIVVRFSQALREECQARFGGPDLLPLVSLAGSDAEIDGKTLGELMRAWRCDLTDAVLEVERRSDASSGIGALPYAMNEANLRRILQHPLVMIASDAGLTPFGELPAQPRGYGTYPRVLGKYVREEGILTLGEAIKKMTSMPAERFGVRDRGRLRPGAFADIVIFDRRAVAENATFVNPHQYPVGIPYVIVNGKLAVDNGKTADAHYGRALRSSA